MDIIIHKADTRGHANHGWLNAHHTFSFADYFNPNRIHFGALRVLNDDIIASGKGFGMHSHENMEIITIPLEGDLQHKDNMGNSTIIRQGDVQVMSAGSGVLHSEFNPNSDKDVNLFQIWIFPNKNDVEPRYDQISIREIEVTNQFYQILSPNRNEQGVWIHQDAWFHLGNFEQGIAQTYQLKNPENGVYAIIIEGEAELEGQRLSKRDGLAIWNTSEFNFKALAPTKILLMEVPMIFALKG